MSKRMSRSNESPMDFAYETPSPSTSNWLSSSHPSDENRSKRGRGSENDAEMSPAYTFGNESSGSSNSRGAFLFHQSLSPTHVGPDVDMHNATPPSQRHKEGETEKSGDITKPGRPISSSGALTRVTKKRQQAKNSVSNSSNKHVRRSGSLGRRMRQEGQDQSWGSEEEAEEKEWEDKDEREEKSKRSLARKMGDTLNVQYIIGGAGAAMDSGMQDRSWLDPEWCLGMAQFIFNASILVGVLWLLLQVILTLQRDISDKVREYEMDYLAEVEGCSHAYHLNRCGTEGAVPALASACAAWQRCSARDPAVVGRARVTAETVAEIVNGFVDVVSWKSMIFTLLSLVIAVGATNSTLSFFRLKSRKANEQQRAEGREIPAPPPSQPLGYHPMYHHHQPPYAPHMYASPSHEHWHASSPLKTPERKRMCR